jgi:hypothetical protein
MNYAIASSAFHSTSDTRRALVTTRFIDRTVGPTIIRKHTVTQDLKLSYRFYEHFHPYVRELIQRLVEESVRGFQDTDTEYEENADGTLKALPNTTRATLSADTKVTIPDGTESTIPRGTQLTLLDGLTVTIPSNKQAVLPGDLVMSEPRGMRVAISGGTETISFGEQITLVNVVSATVPNGSPVKLPAGSSLNLLDCKPRPKLYQGIFSQTQYDPSDLVQQPYPVKDLNFTPRSAYAAYNWELFYHVPITIAIHLSKNQRFEEAQRWFHYIFDPTDDSGGPTPERFWKVKPFQYTDVKLVEDVLVNLSTGADPELQQDTINSIGAWKDTPFRPHVVARYRQTAYMFKAVMAYLDNLIGWGDSLFRQDTGESINEATQLYVLAANILGPRPQAVPKKGSVRPQTYADLRTHLDKFGNALVKFESDIPFNSLPHPVDGNGSEKLITLQSIGRALYFCIPRNDKLLSYWDTTADRLFKIRNSLNILGIFRQLPLFEPPIDPALLARAAAAGLDVAAVVSGTNQPLPLVRFQNLVQRAAEICQEVKSLGNNFLSAIEKEDNEALAILRARHERSILELVETVKYSQWVEAIKSREGLERSLSNAAERYAYYERQLGKRDNEIKIAELEALDTAELAKMKLKVDEPAVALRQLQIDIARDLSGQGGGKKMNTQEVEELMKLMDAQQNQDAASNYDQLGAILGLIPTFGARFQPFGAGGTISFGGSNLAAMQNFSASQEREFAGKRSYEAGKAGKIGSYARREQDWAFQSNLAVGEINQIFKQLRAAQIREAIAEREWTNHQQQIKNAEEIEYFLTAEKNTEWKHKIDTKQDPKKTNKAFYTWMKREVKGLYGQVFQFAFDIARKAERALQHELGNSQLSFLQFGYLGGKEGLLAGEKLYLDIKRMEMAYHDLNQREYELTKQVSLQQVNPLALLQLRTTGRCTVSLPEELFDLDCPGHYFRRIKSVALSIPCVTGPYTGVNCTLTLLKSAIRTNSLNGEQGYTRAGADDARFSDHFGSLEAIVTSTGQGDSGLFETNLRDERYLPFEGSGVVSEWQLELPANPSNHEPQQFDYETISDVVIQLRYTAREGGGLLRKGAIANLTAGIDEAQTVGSVRLFSIRHEFPSEWAKFKNTKLTGSSRAELTLNLLPEHYPFWSKGKLDVTRRVDLFARTDKPTVEVAYTADGTGNKDSLVKDNSLGGIRAGRLANVPLPTPTGKLTLYANDNSMKDLWVTVTWGKEG